MRARTFSTALVPAGMWCVVRRCRGVNDLSAETRVVTRERRGCLARWADNLAVVGVAALTLRPLADARDVVQTVAVVAGPNCGRVADVAHAHDAFVRPGAKLLCD